MTEHCVGMIFGECLTLMHKTKRFLRVISQTDCNLLRLRFSYDFIDLLQSRKNDVGVDEK